MRQKKGEIPKKQRRVEKVGLARLQLADRPDKLAAGFRKTLTAWRRSSKFYTYREAGEFGRMLEAWLNQVARELLPKNPAAALALFESFIEADGTLFERADDSGGAVGDVVRAACRHWLQAAARCDTPASVWPSRLVRLVIDDPYGAREELLRREMKSRASCPWPAVALSSATTRRPVSMQPRCWWWRVR